MRGQLPIMLLVTMLAHSGWCFANESMGTPAARAEFEKGDAARNNGDFVSACKAYHRATEIDPSFATAHKNYILMRPLAKSNCSEKSGSLDNPNAEEERVRKQLVGEYEELSRQHPDRAVYQWALGFIIMEYEPQAAERHAHEALRIDPKFAPAFDLLSSIDSARGNLEAERQDLRNAVEANPDNPEYLLNYASELKETNPQEFVRLSLELLERFPDSDSASPTLYMLADLAATPEEKTRYLEMLKAKFPPSKGYLSEGGMRMLFEVYDRTDPRKALALAKEMETAKPEESDWGLYANYEQQMISAEKLLATGKAGAAAELLAHVRLPEYADHTRLDTLRARATDGSGETDKAYEYLLKIFASNPTDELQAAITSYAQKLGKTQKQTDADILRMRDANAKTAFPFTLPGYGETKQVRLSDFKGRVVLLNFWYPECGPCRAEFPYLRAVFEKYRSQGLAVIAVNIAPAQDDFVLSLLKGYKLDFISARDDKKVSKAYDPEGIAPVNFLIGRDGRIWFNPPYPIFNASRQRGLELQVEWLLRLKDDADRK